MLAVSLSDPNQAAHLAHVLNVDLIVAPHGTPRDDALPIPVLTAPPGTNPTEVLEANLASPAAVRDP